MMKLVEGRGSMVGLDRAALDELRIAMEGWPIHDPDWWRGLWEGMPLAEGGAELVLRAGLYQALYELLPEDEWIWKLHEFNALEDPAAARYGLALWSMAQCLGQRINGSTYARLFDLPQTDAWSRVLVDALPRELRWPSQGFLSLPESARERLIALRDSNQYAYRSELLLRQWDVLGPAEANASIERYILEGSPAEASWARDGALHIQAAISALGIRSTPEWDQRQMEYTRQLLRDMVQAYAATDVSRIMSELRYTTQFGSAENRARLVEVLGEEGLAALDPDARAWLVGK
jgi:hypothetical protein